jgi:phage tail sheath protein FI
MPTYLSPGVYVEELESGSRPIEGVGTAVAAIIGVAPQGPVNTPTLVTNWSQYTSTFGEFVEGAYLAHAVYGYLANGGTAVYVIRVGADGDTPTAPPTPRAELPAGSGKPLTVRAVDGGTGLSVEIGDASEGGEEGNFRLEVRRGDEVVENYDNLTVRRGKQNVATVVNNASRLITIEAVSQVDGRPANGRYELALPAPAPVVVPRVSPEQYVGDVADRTGFSGLETVDAVTMVLAPDLMAAYSQSAIDLDGVKAVQTAMIAHCELMGDRVAILDAPPGLNADQVRTWRLETAGYDSKYATLYWPHIKVLDPATGRNIFIPPSGHIAGVWARSDAQRGVHKAPANEVVRNSIGLETKITRGEHDLLNPHGINCIRVFPGRGVRVWGARTLSSDPAWRYLNVRRLFNYIEESILQNTDWVVFEPNDLDLWQRIRRTITAFLTRVWREGALFGATPEEAFYVKCDSETNPPEVVDAGQVIVEIGIAPVKPAEFVVFRLAQFSGGASVNE